jgi:hypothetical protein
MAWRGSDASSCRESRGELALDREQLGHACGSPGGAGEVTLRYPETPERMNQNVVRQGQCAYLVLPARPP